MKAMHTDTTVHKGLRNAQIHDVFAGVAYLQVGFSINIHCLNVAYAWLCCKKKIDVKISPSVGVMSLRHSYAQNLPHCCCRAAQGPLARRRQTLGESHRQRGRPVCEGWACVQTSRQYDVNQFKCLSTGRSSYLQFEQKQTQGRTPIGA